MYIISCMKAMCFVGQSFSYTLVIEENDNQSPGMSSYRNFLMSWIPQRCEADGTLRRRYLSRFEYHKRLLSRQSDHESHEIVGRRVSQFSLID